MPDAFNNQTTRWGKVEGWWLHHPDTDADHICMLATLSTYADDRGTCHPSQATLARHVRRSRPWVNRVIAELTAMGLIRKTARTRTNNAGTTSCEYRLVNRREALDCAVVPVTEATAPSHDADTPSQEHDTTQPITKQTNHARSAEHRPMDDHVPERSVQPSRSQRIEVPADWAPSQVVMARATLLCPDTDLQAPRHQVRQPMPLQGLSLPSRRTGRRMAVLACGRYVEGRSTRQRPRGGGMHAIAPYHARPR